MTLWEALILGLVQGLTEFLPVSSSGHLVLLQRLFGVNEAVLTFDVMVHLGTLLAVITVFRQDISAMIRRPWDKLPRLIIVGVIPTAVIGFVFSDFFAKLFSTGQTLGIGFLVTGAILWLAESIRSRNRSLHSMTYGDAAFIGLMQGLAILPAVSRSGLTIAGALFRGLDRELAARYSFLLSLPAILGASVLEAKDLSIGIGVEISLLPLLVGIITASVSGYVAIKFMLRLLASGSIRKFSYYVWILGVLVLVDQLFTHRFFAPLF